MQYETKKTQIHTNTKKSMHSEMCPVWQNPIQRTVRTAHLSVLMTVHNFSTQYSTEQFWQSPLLPPDKHHSSDAVYWKGGVSEAAKVTVFLATHWLCVADFVVYLSTGSRPTYGRWAPRLSSTLGTASLYLYLFQQLSKQHLKHASRQLLLRLQIFCGPKSEKNRR